MKIFRLFVLLITLVALSCSNEFDLLEPTTDIPIVYGFLNVSDTAQYIRLERAFASEDTSALELAQNPNELYYENATIEIVRENTGDVWQLIRVDGNLEGFQREGGAFAQSPNTLYKIKSEDIGLVPGETFRLKINRGDSFDSLITQTVVLQNSNIRIPNPDNPTLNMSGLSQVRLLWSGDINAGVYNVSFEIVYRERSNETNGTYVQKVLFWPVRQNLNVEEERVEYEFDGTNFYNFLGGMLEVRSDIDRRFEQLNMIVTAGGKEIEDFVNVNTANLGITSTQDVPVSTNIPMGRGIFSSISKSRLEGILLTGTSLDSLKEGRFTRDLNFN